MALAYEHFRALREKTNVPETMSTQEASRVLNEMISECRLLTMSQLPDSNSKQLCSILFSHEGGLISAYSALNEPVLVREKSKARRNMNLLFALLSVLLGAAAVYLIWNSGVSGRFLFCLFTLSSVILALLGAFLPKKGDGVKAEATVNMDELLSLASRRMDAIDRDLDAFLSIPKEGSSADDSMVQIITLANSLKRSDPDSVPDELMTAISALSLSKGYEFLEYNADTEAFFDTMPTKRETRTIVPAVVKDKALIARGMAIVSMMGETEAKA